MEVLSMSRWLLAAAAVAALVVFAPMRVSAEPKHRHLHHALHEMREAHKELKEAKHNFGGHREKALDALDGAIRQTEKALESAGDPFKGFTPGKIYGGYKNHPHLRHSLHEMREARTELKEAKHNFGGHREKAIKDLNVAIDQVEKCIAQLK
jgi:L-lactate utilization protein LutB